VERLFDEHSRTLGPRLTSFMQRPRVVIHRCASNKRETLIAAGESNDGDVIVGFFFGPCIKSPAGGDFPIVRGTTSPSHRTPTESIAPVPIEGRPRIAQALGTQSQVNGPKQLLVPGEEKTGQHNRHIIGSVNPCRCRLRLTRLCDRTECVSERLPSRLRRAVFATSCSEKRWRRIPAALSVATEGQELRPIAALLRREQARIHIHRDFSLQHILPLPTSAPSPAWPAPEPRLT
jgi:hypothetical protein